VNTKGRDLDVCTLAVDSAGSLLTTDRKSRLMELTRATPRNGAHLADTVSGAAATMVLAERA
jgi:hypothetical protein